METTTEVLSAVAVANLVKISKLAPYLTVGSVLLTAHPLNPQKKYKQYYGLDDEKTPLIQASLTRIYRKDTLTMETALFLHTGYTHILLDIDIYDNELYRFQDLELSGKAMKQYFLEHYLHNGCFAVPSNSDGLHLYISIPRFCSYNTAIGCDIITRASDGRPVADILCSHSNFGSIPYKSSVPEQAVFSDPCNLTIDPFPLVQRYIE